MGTSQSTSSSGFNSAGQRTSMFRENTGLSSSSGGNSAAEHQPVNVRERKGKARASSGSLATLRRRLLLRRRRTSKSPDHSKHLRDLVSGWSLAEISALCEQYEALLALKDLSVQADLARPPATGKKLDLCTLFESKLCADVEIVFNGVCFPAHRAILSARCPYFRQVLARCPGFGARICLDLRTPGIDVKMFQCLLKFLYTGELVCQNDLPLLARLAEEFGGTPNPLEQDLRYLLETGDFADAMLVFTSEGQAHMTNEGHLTSDLAHLSRLLHHSHHGHASAGTGGSSSSSSSSGNSEYGFSSLSTLELPCHKAVLASRSAFFRSLVQRRNRGEELQPERAGLNLATRIVLDERVIPQRFARVLLHAIYLDVVDLSLVTRTSGGIGSPGLSDTGGPTALEDAMELYEIGRFLELDILSQGCEDLLHEMLGPQTLPALLAWGSRPYGSAWVHRQAMNHLREDFQLLAQSPVLFQLGTDHLRDALSSDFLQASELEVLQAVLRWGEHQLIRRMEDREPNLLSHTAHSVARKGIKKRDLSDIELREILSPLLPLVRMDHVLPSNSEILNQAIRRGLVPTPPSHMLGGDRESLRINAWIRTSSGSTQGLFVRPRLFMPYYEEIKSILEDQYQQGIDLVRANRSGGRFRRGDNQDIPDTLYMVEERPPRAQEHLREPSSISDLSSLPPGPDAATMNQMLKREQKLRQSPLVMRALALPLTSRHLVSSQVRLRVVREFNLPDSTAQLLENAALYYKDQEEEISSSELEDVSPAAMQGPPQAMQITSQQQQSRGISHLHRNIGGSRAPRNSTFPRMGLYAASEEQLEHYPPGGIRNSLTRRVRPELEAMSSHSDGQLSEIMPDVAMATSSFSQLQLEETVAVGVAAASSLHDHQSEIELDLGDGQNYVQQFAAPYYYSSRYFPHRNLRDPREY